MSAEKLVSDFSSRRLASELVAFGEATEMGRQIAEWGGKKLRIPLEDDAVVTARGVEWLSPINHRVQLIR